jgi:hypothetical protein
MAGEHPPDMLTEPNPEFELVATWDPSRYMYIVVPDFTMTMWYHVPVVVEEELVA